MDLDSRVRDAAAALSNRFLAGIRPGDWNEAEAVLAALILFYADPSRLSGSRAGHRQHPAVVAAARAIGRTENAVVLKVMNLRSVLTGGGRGMAHGARVDQWVMATFAGHLDQLVEAAQIVGEVIPDAQAAIDLLVELDTYHADAAGDVTPAELALDEYGQKQPIITDIRRQVLVRRGQGLFRSRVMSNYVHACGFCGLRALRPENEASLLVASHIRPWRKASAHERLDPRNGLALCAIHDRAFDSGLMTVDEGLRVVVWPNTKEHYGGDEQMRPITDLHGVSLRRDGPVFDAPGASYLAFHREYVFGRIGRSQ